MTSFALKIVAIISMLCDHLSYAIFGHFSILNFIGRISFPIFAFQISEGFTHTKNVEKYFLRLGIFAILSQIPFSLFLNKFGISDPLTLNIFFTLLLGLLSIYSYVNINKLCNKNNSDKFTSNGKSIQNNNLKYVGIIFGLITVILIALGAELFHIDYGAWGVILIFTFYLFKNNRILKIASFFILVLLRYIKPLVLSNFNYLYILMFISTLPAILFIDLYNGKQGKKVKYLLYWFYPIHLLAIILLF